MNDKHIIKSIHAYNELIQNEYMKILNGFFDKLTMVEADAILQKIDKYQLAVERLKSNKWAKH